MYYSATFRSDQGAAMNDSFAQDDVPTLPLPLALIPIALLVFLLAVAVATFGDDTTGGPAQIALIFCGMVAALIGHRQGLTWRTLEKAVETSIARSLVAILILLAVGSLIGVWMAAGIIPTIIYYGSLVLSPSIFYVASLILCAVVSVSIGSSWTTVGTIGVALIGLATAMGLSVEMTAGAIISGAYFGDKMSPLSDTTNLASGLSGTDLFKHIGFLLWTTVPAITIAIIFFSFATLTMEGGAPESEMDILRETIASAFVITPALFLPLLFMLVMGVRGVPAFVAIFISTLIGAVLGAAIQDDPSGSTSLLGEMQTYWLVAASGFVADSGDAVLDDLLSGGGMASMLNAAWLVVSAMFFSGMLERSGILRCILMTIISRLKSPGALVAGTGLTAMTTNAVASDQYLSIVLTSRMYAEEYKKRELDSLNLSRAVEDWGTVTSPLVPWNTCGAFMAATLGVPTFAYLPFCIFNLTSPVIAMSYAATGFKILKAQSSPSTAPS